jgi:NitT/TauT family transport system ATP-binding protein
MTSICVRNLEKRYRTRDGDVAALSGVELEVGRGEFVAIVGPSGCGKSTLLYILGGFIGADGGSVAVDGKPVAGPGIDRGVVFQEYALFPWLTVTQNICYGLEMTGVRRAERHAIAERLIRTIGLAGFEHRFPRELSGGMKQRVAIARTLAYARRFSCWTSRSALSIPSPARPCRMSCCASGRRRARRWSW